MERISTVFFGTADLAAVTLQTLSRCGMVRLLAVVSQPDKPKGRNLKLQPTPVKVEASKLGLPVLQPIRARDPAFIAQLAAFHPDLIVVAAYGQILPLTILNLPRWGCLNVHTSLLPKYRGAAPIQWAILEDEPETGVTIMKMDAGLDTGDMLTRVTTPIHASDDGQTLHDRLAALGADLLVRTIPDYVDGRVRPCPQPSVGVSHARKITREDGRLDWTLPARHLWNRIRAFVPWPGAYTSLPDEKTRPLLKVWSALVEPHAGMAGEVIRADERGISIACGAQALRLTEVQREGGKRIPIRQFLQAYPLVVGQRFQ